MKEKYYAVKIGELPRNKPYFMLRNDAMTPWLFISRGEAQEKCPKQARTKVVVVWVTPNDPT